MTVDGSLFVLLGKSRGEHHAMANMRQWVAWTEKRLARVVVDEGLHVGLAEVKQGPLVVTFRLRLLKPDRRSLDRLLKLGPTFAQALHVESVRVVDTAQGILVEIPSPMPKTPPASLLAQHTQGLAVAMGLDQWRRPISVDLAHHPTILAVGPTRRGKTQALKSTLFALARTNPARRLRYVIVSQKRGDWEAFAGAAGCFALISDPDEALTALEWAAGIFLQERAKAGQTEPALLIVIDDLINLLKRVPNIASPIGEIASMGGGLQVFQLIGTQGAGSKATTGGDVVENNVTCRLVYRASSATTGARSAGAGGLGVEALTGQKGDALLIVDDRVERIATGFADDRDIMQLPAGPEYRPWAGAGDDRRSDRIRSTPDIRSNGYGTGDIRHNRGETPSSTPRDAHVDGDAGDGAGDGYADAFPLRVGRPLTGEEKVVVRRLATLPDFQYRGELSLNRLTTHVYGSKSPDRLEWIRDALAEEGDTIEEAQEDAGPGASRAGDVVFDDGETLDISTPQGRAFFDALYQSGNVRFPEPSTQK